MQSTNLRELLTLRLLAEWHEDDGEVLWWKLPITEPPYVGSPLDEGVLVTIKVADRDYSQGIYVHGWPGYHTHWSPIPSVVEQGV